MMKSKRKGAQASYRIDFTTFTNMPIATKTDTIHGYINLTMNYQRVGNIVFASNIGVILNYPSGYSMAYSGDCPEGYRPKTAGVIFGQNVDYNANDVTALYTVNNNGKCYVSAQRTGNARLAFSGIWITGDEYPTD